MASRDNFTVNETSLERFGKYGKVFLIEKGRDKVFCKKKLAYPPLSYHFLLTK